MDFCVVLIVSKLRVFASGIVDKEWTVVSSGGTFCSPKNHWGFVMILVSVDNGEPHWNWTRDESPNPPPGHIMMDSHSVSCFADWLLLVENSSIVYTLKVVRCPWFL